MGSGVPKRYLEAKIHKKSTLGIVLSAWNYWSGRPDLNWGLPAPKAVDPLKDCIYIFPIFPMRVVYAAQLSWSSLMPAYVPHYRYL